MTEYGKPVRLFAITEAELVKRIGKAKADKALADGFLRVRYNGYFHEIKVLDGTIYAHRWAL